MSFRAPRHRDCTQWLSRQNSILSCCTTQTNTTPPCHRTTRLPSCINKTKAISYLRTTRRHYLTTSHPLSCHYPTLPHCHLFLFHVLRRCSTFIFINEQVQLENPRSINNATAKMMVCVWCVMCVCDCYDLLCYLIVLLMDKILTAHVFIFLRMCASLWNVMFEATALLMMVFLNLSWYIHVILFTLPKRYGYLVFRTKGHWWRIRGHHMKWMRK